MYVMLLPRCSPHALSTFLVTCCSSCCCLLCFLAGRGGGVSFKGKGSTDVAMTSGQGADEGWVTGWRERVEGNGNPEQTAALCFRGGRRGIHRPVWDERTDKTEAQNLWSLCLDLLCTDHKITNDEHHLSIYPPAKILHCRPCDQ